jgi:hypothetical protein
VPAANQQIKQPSMQTGYTPTNLETLPVNTCTNHYYYYDYSKTILTLLYKMKKWNPKTTSNYENLILRINNRRRHSGSSTIHAIKAISFFTQTFLTHLSIILKFCVLHEDYLSSSQWIVHKMVDGLWHELIFFLHHNYRNSKCVL